MWKILLFGGGAIAVTCFTGAVIAESEGGKLAWLVAALLGGASVALGLSCYIAWRIHRPAQAWGFLGPVGWAVAAIIAARGQ